MPEELTTSEAAELEDYCSFLKEIDEEDFLGLLEEDRVDEESFEDGWAATAATGGPLISHRPAARARPAVWPSRQGADHDRHHPASDCSHPAQRLEPRASRSNRGDAEPAFRVDLALSRVLPADAAPQDRAQAPGQQRSRLFLRAKAVETEANNKGIPVLVAPAVNYSPDYWQPVEWLRAFFDECVVLYGPNGCRVDALSVHAYSCTLKKLKEYLAIYEEFNLPIWLTEFACVEDENRLEACGQAEYMVEILEYLENNPNVTKYSWFSYNFTTRDDGKISEAALTDVQGRLTPLGEIYSALVRTSYAGLSSSSPSKLISHFGVSLLLAAQLALAFGIF